MHTKVKNLQENWMDCKSARAEFSKLQNYMLVIKQSPDKLMCFHQFYIPCYKHSSLEFELRKLI